jgi:HlyD family secretion protein
VSAHPEHPQSEPTAERRESVTWIGDRLPQGGSPAAAPPRDVPIPDGIRRKPVLWGIGLVVLVVAVVALLAARNSTAPSQPVAAADAQQSQWPLVSVTTPGVQPVTTTVTFTGTIHARYDMPISAEGEGGRITAVLVEAGDRVKRGQVLARLDQSVLRPQVNRLAASLEEAKAQAALSAAEYRRALGVEAAGALSAEEIARRQATAVTDEARVKVAAAQLAEAQARLEKTEIRAPADGIVLTRTAEVGQTASPGTTLFRLAANGEMEMRGLVAEQDLAALSVKQPALVRLTGIEQPFEGEVRLLGAVIDPQTRLGEIRIALGSHPSIRPGAFARGEVVVGNASRPVLPQTAVLSDSEGTYVLIVNDEGRTERRAVRVGSTIAQGMVISEGLTGTERVVTTAGAFLRIGEPVRIAPTPQTSS